MPLAWFEPAGPASERPRLRWSQNRHNTAVWTGCRPGSWNQPGQTCRINNAHTSCDVCPYKCSRGLRRQLHWNQHRHNTDNEYLSGHTSPDTPVQTSAYKRISCSQSAYCMRCKHYTMYASDDDGVEFLLMDSNRCLKYTNRIRLWMHQLWEWRIDRDYYKPCKMLNFLISSENVTE